MLISSLQLNNDEYVSSEGCVSTFVDHPSDSTALTNQPFTLSCLVHDDPPLPTSLVWLKDDVMQSSNERVQISYNTSTGYSLYAISNVLYADDGDYKCQAYSDSNNIVSESTTGTLIVKGIPAFDPPLQPQSVVAGSTVTLSCPVVSNPTATVPSWSFNGEVLEEDAQVTINGDEVTIFNAQSSNQGFYKCSTTNSFGMNSTTAKLTIIGMIQNHSS